MNRFLSIMFFMSFLFVVNAQKYRVQNSKITFYSEAPLEDISAENEKVQGLFNSENGELAFIVNIRDFQFENSLMQEHFNEKYMESDKFPKSIFTGILMGYEHDSKSVQEVQAKGKLTIHGVTKELDISGDIQHKGKLILIDATFNVELEEFDIDRPQMMWQNIAEVIEVKVHLELEKQ